MNLSRHYPQKRKNHFLKLLPLVFFNTIQDLQNQINKKNSIYYQLFLPNLSIIQSNTKYLNNIIFPQISNTFVEIIQKIIWRIKYGKKRIYEILEGFYIYNMKQEEKVKRIIRSLYLKKLFENCPVDLLEKYGKIWTIKLFNSIILGDKGFYTQYTNSTLNKVEFLTEDDWNKRDLALNIVFS